jgi:hypothetical protein
MVSAFALWCAPVTDDLDGRPDRHVTIGAFRRFLKW